MHMTSYESIEQLVNATAVALADVANAADCVRAIDLARATAVRRRNNRAWRMQLIPGGAAAATASDCLREIDLARATAVRDALSESARVDSLSHCVAVAVAVATGGHMDARMCEAIKKAARLADEARAIVADVVANADERGTHA